MQADTLSSVSSSHSIVHITPFFNSSEEPSNRAFCYLLEIDSSRIILDCGVSFNSDGSPDHSYLSDLKKIAYKDIDAVLCTHASLPHIGGLPFLLSFLPSTTPIYMTLGALSMAHVLFSDALVGVLSVNGTEASDKIYSKDEDTVPLLAHFSVSEVMNRITGVRYSQPAYLSGNISFVPLPAGHSLGGCFWKIKKGPEDIIYSVDFNLKKDRHLEGSSLPLLTTRPSIMIADSTFGLSVHQNRKGRDTEFLESIVGHLKNVKGNVLVPVPPNGVLLEFLLLLEYHWISSKLLSTYPLHFVGSEALRLVDFAKSMLEWMGDGVMKAFEANRENPFEFKAIKCFSSLKAYEDSAASGSRGPKVILASGPDAQFGYSKSLIPSFLSNSKNLIFFASQNPAPGSLSDLLKKACIGSSSKPSVSFKIFEREYLQGPELELYQKSQQSSSKKLELEELEDSDDEISEADTLSRNPLFPSPYRERRRIQTLYGQALRPEEWPAFDFRYLNPPALGLVEPQQLVSSPLSFAAGISLDGLASALSLPEMPASASLPYRMRSKFYEKELIQCHLKWMDFFTVSDGKSTRLLLEKLNPRKIVLVHGGQAEGIFMSESLKVSRLAASSASTEADASFVTVASSHMSRLNVSVLPNMFIIKLSDSLLDSINMQSKSGYELAKIDGILKSDGDSSVVRLEFPDAVESSPSERSILSSLWNAFSTTIPASPLTLQEHVLIGDTKLLDLKKKLSLQGYSTELKQGRLLVNHGQAFLYKVTTVEFSFSLPEHPGPFCS